MGDEVLQLPATCVDDILNMLGQSKWSSMLDLVSGYWQIPVHKDNIEKTAFMTRHGTYKFTIMPFSLMNAPTSFQQDMDVVLLGLNWVNMLMYLDNIIMFSQTFKEHLTHLQAVFKQLAAANMFIKPNKCNFCHQELLFLGHIVQHKGIVADPEKLCVINKMVTLANVTELQAFLGLCNYYWQFVPVFTTIATLLYVLLQGEPFHWIQWLPECKTVFSMLKTALTTALVLVFPNFEALFFLYTNTSKAEIGAVLSQKDGEGHEQVVAYTSWCLSKSECNYSMTEWEHKPKQK